MKNSVIGLIIGIIVLFCGLMILPIYYNAVIDWRDDMNLCQTAARNFVDKVIDNGKITESMIEDLNLELAACTSTFSYKYYREARVVNTDGSGHYEPTWVTTEVKVKDPWKTGDICTIVIEQESTNLFQRISGSLLGVSYNNRTVRLSGMVR